MKITACYIVANEADDLRKSVQSIESIADEILIVDTGGNPAIRQIACEYNSAYLRYKWQDDFADARNFALRHISGEWIIFLDADEYLLNPVEVRPYLQKIEAEHPQVDAVISLRHEYDKDMNQEQGICLVIRFFRARQDLHYEGRIHEVLVAEEREMNTVEAKEQLQLMHTGYSASVSQNKTERNMRIMQKEEQEYGLTPRLMYYYCQTYFNLHDYENALHYGFLAYRAHVPLLTPHFSLYHWIIESMRNLDYPLPTMLKWASEAVNEFPYIPEFYGERMMILSAMGELLMARANALKALDLYQRPQNTLTDSRYAIKSVQEKIEKRLMEIDTILIQQGVNPHELPLAMDSYKTIIYFSVNGSEPSKELLSLCHRTEKEAGPIWGETGIPGLYLDFNAGVRLEIPEGEWYVRISDADSSTVFLEMDVSNQILISLEKKRIPWRVDVAKDGVWVFSHTLDYEGQCVCFNLGDTLGDVATVLPYIRKFAHAHHCRVGCKRKKAFASYIKAYYPEVEQFDYIPLEAYAVYYVNTFKELELLTVENRR